MAQERNHETILTDDLSNKATVTQQEPLLGSSDSKSNKKVIIAGAGIFVATLVIMIIVITRNGGGGGSEGGPQSIRMAIPASTVIELGDSRVIEVLFYSGKDARNVQGYTAVKKRKIEWSLEPAGIVSIDPYGRLETLNVGSVQVKVQSSDNSDASDTKTIHVVKAAEEPSMGKVKRIVNFQGTKARPQNLPQKLVTRLDQIQALSSPQVPSSMKDFLKGVEGVQPRTVVQQDGVKWQIKPYSDGSKRSYLLRTNTTAADSDRNKLQYFIGDRYLPGKGDNIISVQDDGQNGVWTTNAGKEVTHIVFTALNASAKAARMSKNYQPYLRYGLAGGTDYHAANDTWIAGVSDNDGLWASMYGVGELMRYSYVKDNDYTPDVVTQARKSALRTLKAVLMVSNVGCRDKIIDARIRHLNNTIAFDGNHMSPYYLNKGATYAIDNYAGNAMDGVGLFGSDAGQTIDGLSYGGSPVYSYRPLQASDWGYGEPALTKRTLKGFITRSFGIKGIDTIPHGGLFFGHNPDGTQTILQEAQRLYDYNSTQRPVLDIGKLPLPEVLLDILNVNGKQYNKSDLFYKGDTSTDEVIGHLFIYKVAFDVLHEEDPEEKKLKQLVRDTMVNFCTSLADNGYAFVDATGQATTWGNMARDFMNSDFTLQDAPVKTIQVLLSFKLCAYVTGDNKWEQEYQFLVQDPAFKYLDVVAGVWKRWLWRNFHNSYFHTPLGFLDPNVDYTQEEIIRHVMHQIHYSDEEESLLAFYLAFQLQKNEDYLAKYRQGLQGWWNSISRSENPLWYFVYQLAYPKEQVKDHFGNDILKTAMWQLERHPISTRKYTAYIEGSRPDVLLQGVNPILSVDPKTFIQRRKNEEDALYIERPLNKKTVPDYDPLNIYEIKVLPKDQRCMNKFNSATFQDPSRGSPNSMEPPTTYTLPFWMGVYHQMIDIQ